MAYTTSYSFATDGHIRDTILVGLVETDEQRRQVYELRRRVYRETNPYLLDENSLTHPAEDRYDAGSYLFHAHTNGRIIATGRLSPLLDDDWEVPELAPLVQRAPVASSGMLYASRGVVDERFRGVGIIALLLHHGYSFAARHTRFESYVAICAPELLPFYRQIGVEWEMMDEIRIRTRKNRRYIAMYGDLQRTATTMASYLSTAGWQPSTDAPTRRIAGEHATTKDRPCKSF